MRRIQFMLLATTALLVSCGQPAEQAHQPDDDHAHEVHWGYEGEIGPDHWADLSPEFALCDSGKMQSPIDLTDAVPMKGLEMRREIGTTVLTRDLRASVMDILDNGHTIQITNDAPVSVDVEGEHYELVQYHVHAPSEHTIEGEHAPLEVHFVHKSAKRKLAVIAVLIEDGDHDPAWDAVIASLPSGPEDERHLEGLDVDVTEFQLLPLSYYRYEGSLTTPPCSEGVRWIVMAEKRQMSTEQLAAFLSRLHDNNRPLQPLGDRAIQSVGL